MTRAFAVTILVALLAGCGASLPPPEHFSETPVGSGNWTPLPAEPPWVARPPSREGSLVVVAEGRSNLRSIAASAGRPSAAAEAARRVRDALVPVVGEADAERAAAAAPAALRMTARACREEVLTREAVPGNTLCTAWALWEAPLGPILSVLHEGRRDAARAALGACCGNRPGIRSAPPARGACQA